jgi:hypothetical protein
MILISGESGASDNGNDSATGFFFQTQPGVLHRIALFPIKGQTTGSPTHLPLFVSLFSLG